MKVFDFWTKLVKNANSEAEIERFSFSHRTTTTVQKWWNCKLQVQKWLIPILGVKYERKLCRIVDIYIVTLFAYAIINKMLLREHDILSPCILKPEFQKKSLKSCDSSTF